MPDNPLVLLVDDEEDILDLYGTKLRQEGLNVATAISGAECLKLAKRDHPGLILLDLKMPVMDGAQVFTKLKADPETQDAKVVFLTAFSDPRGQTIDAKYAKEMGAAGYMKKGMALNEFVEEVKKYLK